MKRSTTRILTTHAGSLPWLYEAAPATDAELREAVANAVHRQRELGLDLINEGEYTKGGDWLSFADDRFAGFETRAGDEKPLIAQGRDREEFDAFYRYATDRGTLFYTPGGQVSARRLRWVCAGPISYAGHEQVRREIEILRACEPGEDAFLTSTAPASLEVYRANAYYADDVEYLYALADALRVEYELIVDAGFGVAHDLELVHLVDILLEVKAQAYLIEGANARHEHEWALWRDVQLPEGKILVPGVVTHSTDVVEHPDLVAQRIERFTRDRRGRFRRSRARPVDG